MSNISTDSFRLASYLVAAGFKIQSTKKAGRKVWFLFEDSQGLRESVDAYRYGDPMVSVRDLFHAQSQVKSLIFDAPFDRGEKC